MGVLRYLSHPEVVIDPAVPVTDWQLSERGRGRISVLCDRGWPAATRRIVSSSERKAREAAEMIAASLGLTVVVRPAQGEIDRSATGYVPHARHEELADRLFANPEQSADGWETAIAARARVLNDLAPILAEPGGGDVLVVGHGGAGTLLLCHFSGMQPDRRHDQPPGGGCVFSLDLTTRLMLHGWRRIEDVIA